MNNNQLETIRPVIQRERLRINERKYVVCKMAEGGVYLLIIGSVPIIFSGRYPLY